MDSESLNSRRYVAGYRCENDHEPIRFISGSCVECSREAGRRYRAKNPGLVTARVRKLRAENPQRHKSLARKQRGLPEPTRSEPGLCECCGGPPTKKGMCLDHDHKTNKFRGWLCSNCNTAIGKLGDSVEGLLKAIDYLKRSKS